ncbi:glutaredoxin domain-containing protein [Neptuniibacter sp. CAU 1671]|uniref:glutaredoxin domain-containing protein n=1 Tax=Neptuniibacter sp. CAU 1671 TaxID=3032593 RepID=UPI0023DA69F1|nr:glutaredoxin domain-containing protein [Neptuniibacter sp. CAU 1671]MDF2182207.1 DUF4124 domain-containing protein [Neptuniibacter sp. CAU 1671]
MQKIVSYRIISSAKRLLIGACVVSVYNLVFLSSANAEVYKWRDSNGVIHFSDRPPAGTHSKKVNIKPVSVVPSTHVEDSTAVIGKSKDKINKTHVVMYGTSWCPYCAKARKYFTANRIPYTEYDVEKLPDRRREFKKFGGTGYPLILIGRNEKMQGFSVEGFERRYYK